MDPEDTKMYWFMVCNPNCRLNAVRRASYQLEQDAAYYCPCSRIKNTVEELRRAWTEYYAYGPDEHEARFEANSKLRGPKQVWKPH